MSKVGHLRSAPAATARAAPKSTRIGEVSRDLEKADQRRGNKHRKSGKLPSVRNLTTKAKTLKAAAISTPSTAHEYEQLASGKEEQAVKAPHLPIAPASSIH